VFVNPVGPGWANPETGSFNDPRLRGRDNKPYGPLPRDWLHFQGRYVSGNQVVIAYTVGDATVLESPGYEGTGSDLALTRTLNVGKSSRQLVLRVCPIDSPAMLVGTNRLKITQEFGFNLLRIPAEVTPIDVKILIGHRSSNPEATVLSRLALASPPPVDLTAFTRGGPPHWQQQLLTH